MTDHSKYYAAKSADDAWSNELVRVFGKQSCNARYDERGCSTPELKRLKDAKLSADRVNHEKFLADLEKINA